MTEYERGWSACREAAVEAANKMADAWISVGQLDAGNAADTVAARLRALTPPAGTGQRREGGES